MNYLKMLGLAAVAAMALTAFGAGTASATELYSGSTTLSVGTEIKASVASGTSAKLTTTEGTTLNTCTGSELTGKISSAGSATSTVVGNVESLTWSGCISTVDTVELGELEIHWIPGTINGTLTAKGFKVTVNTGLFGSCVYTAGAATHMGTLTGSTTGDATMDINANVTKLEGNCPSSAKWVATYKVTHSVYNGTTYTPLHVTEA